MKHASTLSGRQYLEDGVSYGVWSESRVISVLYVFPPRALRLISVDRERKGETNAGEGVNVLRGRIDRVKKEVGRDAGG